MVEIKNILYATDLSSNAKDAYRYASSIAERYSAGLILLHVVQESFDLSVFDINMGRSSSEKKWLEVRTQLQQAFEETVQDIKDQYRDAGMTADEIIIEKGIPSKIILLVAEDRGCDFIVMGMRGRGSTLEGAIMGDTVRRVLHNSRLPVLVVEPQPAEKA